MKYFSVCSGVGTDHLAWQGLGWECVGFAEIDAFASVILAHRYPKVRNYGDFTAITADVGPVDLLVGGTPCQSFSIAGQRAGLDDARGNLTLEFARLARRLRSRWFVWENVPGVLSSDGGRDFAAILTAFRQCGYSVAYRILDAQHYGVPQRRRRVFVVGHFGDDWRPPAEVLFEQASVRRNYEAVAKKGQKVAATLGGGSGSRGWSSDTDRMTCIPVHTPDKTGTLTTKWTAKKATNHQEVLSGALVGGCVPETSPTLSSDCGSRLRSADVPLLTGTWWDGSQTAATLVRKMDHRMPDVGMCMAVLQALPFETNLIALSDSVYQFGDVTPTNDTQGGMHVVIKSDNSAEAVCVTTAQSGADGIRASTELPITLDATHGQAIGFSCKDTGADAGYIAPTLRAGSSASANANGGVMPAVAHSVGMRTIVRRLTPRECERLQGLPDDWTLVPWRGKLASDAPRYKAIGNGMALPVLRWIGQRIANLERTCSA